MNNVYFDRGVCLVNKVFKMFLIVMRKRENIILILKKKMLKCFWENG